MPLSATQVRANELGQAGGHSTQSTSVPHTVCGPRVTRKPWRPAQSMKVGVLGVWPTPTLGGALTGLESEMDRPLPLSPWPQLPLGELAERP